MTERPCDCAARHRRFMDRDPEALAYELLHPPTRSTHLPIPIPEMHQHEDDRCSKPLLGIGGCPGLPHCRDWIVGAYRAGETIADVTGNRRRAFHLRVQRQMLEGEFARRSPL